MKKDIILLLGILLSGSCFAANEATEHFNNNASTTTMIKLVKNIYRAGVYCKGGAVTVDRSQATYYYPGQATQLINVKDSFCSRLSDIHLNSRDKTLDLFLKDNEIIGVAEQNQDAEFVSDIFIK